MAVKSYQTSVVVMGTTNTRRHRIIEWLLKMVEEPCKAHERHPWCKRYPTTLIQSWLEPELRDQNTPTTGQSRPNEVSDIPPHPHHNQFPSWVEQIHLHTINNLDRCACHSTWVLHLRPNGWGHGKGQWVPNPDKAQLQKPSEASKPGSINYN